MKNRKDEILEKLAYLETLSKLPDGHETTRTFSMSYKTLAAWKELAEITTSEKDLGSLLTRALRTWEWIAHCQLNGCVVGSLAPKAIAILKQYGSEQDYNLLDPLFPPEKNGEMATYFAGPSEKENSERKAGAS